MLCRYWNTALDKALWMIKCYVSTKRPTKSKGSGALWVGELTGRKTSGLFVPLTGIAGLFYPAFAATNKWSWPREGGGNLVVTPMSSCSDVLYLKSLLNFPCPWPLPCLPCPFSLLFFSSLLLLPCTSSLYSLGWAEARALEILNNFPWKGFSTQNWFLVFILWWFLLCCNIIMKPFQAMTDGFFPPFCFWNMQHLHPYQPLI